MTLAPPTTLTELQLNTLSHPILNPNPEFNTKLDSNNKSLLLLYVFHMVYEFVRHKYTVYACLHVYSPELLSITTIPFSLLVFD